MLLVTLVFSLLGAPCARAHQLLLPQLLNPPTDDAAVSPAPAPEPPRRPPDPPIARPGRARTGSTRTEAGLVKCATCGPNANLKKQATIVTAATEACDMKRVTARARQIGAGTSSRGMCLPSVRRAFQDAGCAVPAGFAMNAMHAFRELQKVWRCQGGGTAAGAPDGAVIFSVGCGSHHTEIKSNNCYYSDFHHVDCLASSEYVGCRYRQLGWCKP